MKRLRRILVLKKTLDACHRALVVVGVMLLAYSFTIIAERVSFQAWASHETVNRGNLPAAPSAQEKWRLSSWLRTPGHGQPGRFHGVAVLGRLDIPAIHTSAMIAEGDSDHVLRLAVGHVPGSALPDEEGNVVLAGHRDTFFRRLGGLKQGDLIELHTRSKTFFYQVRSTQVVSPEASWVLNPTSGRMLTLVTCYPFYFVGPAPNRFVVHAQLLKATQSTG